MSWNGASVLPREGELDRLDEVLGDLVARERALEGPQRLAVDHREQLLFGDPALVANDVVEALAGLGLERQRVFDLLLGERALAYQCLENPPSHALPSPPRRPQDTL